MSAHAAQPKPLSVWLIAIRPKTLPAAASPVVVGTALAFADATFSFWPAVAALLGALLLQIGSNFANDYFDYFKGADSAERLGPTRVMASGLMSPERLRLGMFVIFGTAALIGLYLVAVGGWPILVVGVAAILAAVAYTGGPFPFGYHGLGDLFVFIFFGVVAVCGTYFVQALQVSGGALLASVAVGALVTNILVVNNLRDIDTDRQAGKQTLAVKIGRTATRRQYLLLLVLAYLVPVLMIIQDNRGLWLLLPWLSLPLARKLLRAVLHGPEGAALNSTLAGSARLALFYCLLLALGIVVGT